MLSRYSVSVTWSGLRRVRPRVHDELGNELDGRLLDRGLLEEIDQLAQTG